jgi:hypothetical protein
MSQVYPQAKQMSHLLNNILRVLTRQALNLVIAKLSVVKSTTTASGKQPKSMARNKFIDFFSADAGKNVFMCHQGRDT